MERIIFKVWNEIKSNIAKELSLKEIPSLEIIHGDKDPYLMCTFFDHLTTGYPVYVCESHSKDYIIRVYIDNINSYYNKLFKSYDSLELKEAFLKFLLCHESRHIWQADGDFYIGRSVDELIKTPFSNSLYGELPQEKDANNYAISKASSCKETCLFELLELHQRFSGLLFLSVEQTKEYNKLFNKFKKQWKHSLIKRLFKSLR